MLTSQIAAFLFLHLTQGPNFFWNWVCINIGLFKIVLYILSPSFVKLPFLFTCLPSHADFSCPSHTLLSVFLLILCLPNVPRPIHTHTHIHAQTNTRTALSSASLSECDWLITTQKAWLCGCQEQDRYPRPQGAPTWFMSPSSIPSPPSFSHFLSPSLLWDTRTSPHVLTATKGCRSLCCIYLEFTFSKYSICFGTLLPHCWIEWSVSQTGISASYLLFPCQSEHRVSANGCPHTCFYVIECSFTCTCVFPHKVAVLVTNSAAVPWPATHPNGYNPDVNVLLGWWASVNTGG